MTGTAGVDQLQTDVMQIDLASLLCLKTSSKRQFESWYLVNGTNFPSCPLGPNRNEFLLLTYCGLGLSDMNKPHP